MGLLAALGGLSPNDDGSLNALQRFGMTLDDNNAIPQIALRQLGSDPNFQQLPAAQQQARILAATGDPNQAQNLASFSQAAQLPTDKGPLAMIGQALKTKQISLPDALAMYANPMLPTGNGAPSNPPQSNPSPSAAAPSAASQNQGINYDLVNQEQRPLVRQIATSILNGTFNPETGKGQNDPAFNAALDLANRADPSLKSNYLARSIMTKNATSGDIYKNSQQINSVIGHLYDLHHAAQGFTTTGSPIVNSIGQGVTNYTGYGALPELSTYNEILDRASPELNKFYVGGEGDKEGRAIGKEAFAPNLPTDIKLKNINTQTGLLQSKASGLQNEYDTAMGNAGTFRIIKPLGQALMKDMQGQPLAPQEQQMVNEHRQKSGLPPKTWGNTQATLPAENLSQPQKIATQADIAATAKKYGKTPEQVAQDAKARGYTIK